MRNNTIHIDIQSALILFYYIWLLLPQFKMPNDQLALVDKLQSKTKLYYAMKSHRK